MMQHCSLATYRSGNLKKRMSYLLRRWMFSYNCENTIPISEETESGFHCPPISPIVVY